MEEAIKGVEVTTAVEANTTAAVIMGVENTMAAVITVTTAATIIIGTEIMVGAADGAGEQLQ
jgi:hypothetical protein